jgi:hypothetical protein
MPPTTTPREKEFLMNPTPESPLGDEGQTESVQASLEQKLAEYYVPMLRRPLNYCKILGDDVTPAIDRLVQRMDIGANQLREIKAILEGQDVVILPTGYILVIRAHAPVIQQLVAKGLVKEVQMPQRRIEDDTEAAGSVTVELRYFGTGWERKVGPELVAYFQERFRGLCESIEKLLHAGWTVTPTNIGFKCQSPLGTIPAESDPEQVIPGLLAQFGIKEFAYLDDTDEEPYDEPA